MTDRHHAIPPAPPIVESPLRASWAVRLPPAALAVLDTAARAVMQQHLEEGAAVDPDRAAERAAVALDLQLAARMLFWIGGAEEERIADALDSVSLDLGAGR